MENKARVTLEIDRAEYDALLFMTGEKKGEESERVWEIMKEGHVMSDFSAFEGNEQEVKFMLIAIAIISTEPKMKKL